MPSESPAANSRDAITSSATIASSSDFNCKTIGLSSPLAVCVSVNPVSATWVKVTSESAPKDKTALSDISLKSSPIDASAATPKPPATVNAPSDAEVFAVVADTLTTPPELIEIASVSEAEPIVPASGITMFPPVVINPPPVYVPDTSKFALTSTSVAFNSTSSVALISNTVALGAPIFCEASLNWITFVELSNIAYIFNGDTITQTVTGATGEIVGDVFSGKKFGLRNVTGTFNSTDVLSSNTSVLNLILDTNSSYTKGAIISLSDGVNAPVATGEILETTTKQNSLKIKVLTGTFSISNILFLTSSDLVNSTGSKIVSISSLSENLIVFNIQDNIALLKTSSSHGVAVGEKINIDINPDDSVSTTTYHVRKRIYQEAVVKIPVISRVLNDSGVGRISIINGGGDYTAAEYKNVVLNGGAGEDAKATIVVSAAGLVNSVTITDKGKNYKKFDILSVSSTALSKQVHLLNQI